MHVVVFSTMGGVASAQAAQHAKGERIALGPLCVFRSLGFRSVVEEDTDAEDESEEVPTRGTWSVVSSVSAQVLPTHRVGSMGAVNAPA